MHCLSSRTNFHLFNVFRFGIFNDGYNIYHIIFISFHFIKTYLHPSYRKWCCLISTKPGTFYSYKHIHHTRMRKSTIQLKLILKLKKATNQLNKQLNKTSRSRHLHVVPISPLPTVPECVITPRLPRMKFCSTLYPTIPFFAFLFPFRSNV